MTQAAPQGFAPPLPSAILPTARYLVVPTLGPEQAQQRIRAEMCDGTFRPPDAAEASLVDALYALFVPFWRVDLQRPDDGLRLTEERRGYLGVPMAQPGAADAKPAWMVCARTWFPYEMKHPTSILPGDTRPLTVGLSALAPGDPDPRYGWEVLDADVDEGTACSLAILGLQRTSLEPGALMGESQVTVRACHFVRYPVWFARYRYRGQAEAFHVGISALDGAPIAAQHPSKLAAGAAKLKKLFGFQG